MVDVDCAVGVAACPIAGDARGYEIDEAEVIYWGGCPECIAAASAAQHERIEQKGTGAT
jgi:Fur family ferric uptake transcriptional regulator